MIKAVVAFLAGIFVAYTYPEIGTMLFGWIGVLIDFVMVTISNYQG